MGLWLAFSEEFKLEARLAVADILLNISFLSLYIDSKISVVEYIESNKKQTQKNCCMFKKIIKWKRKCIIYYNTV